MTTTFGAAAGAANAADDQGSRLAVTRTARDRGEIIGWQNYIPAMPGPSRIARTDYASLRCVKAARILVIFCLASAAIGAGQTQKRATKPDVFLVTIDTLRADHVHCYGYESIQTPALDGLAKDGIRFTHAFTPSPITNTSHTSILTGLLPSSHGVTDFAVPLSATHPTLATLLKTRGYHTAAFIGAVILDSNTLAPGLDRGFDFYDNFPAQPKTKSRWGRVERRGAEVVQHAEAWMTAHPAGPHFVWVHLYDPHDPYEPPPPYSQTYKDRLYDGEIAYADSALAHFIAYLKTSGKYRNSVIVAVGDHGEGLGEHHEDTHGIFLYDSTTHVPLIIKLPGGESLGTTVTAQVRTVDIVPTLLDLAESGAPPKTDGESLRGYFSGRNDVDRPAFGETDYPLRFGWAPLRSVRNDGYKFIESPRPELYDLRQDPNELSNHYDSANARVQKSRAMLAEVQASGGPVDASQPAAQPDANDSTASMPDPKDRIEGQDLPHAAMTSSEDDSPAAAGEAREGVLAVDPESPSG